MTNPPDAARYAYLASITAGHALRAAQVIEDFVAEAVTTYGLTGDEAMAVVDEANAWALARATDPYPHDRSLMEERMAPHPYDPPRSSRPEAGFAADVVTMARTVRAVGRGGQSRGEAAVRCPQMRGDSRCGSKLTVDPYVHRITCERCGTSWDQETGGWITLRGAQLDMEAA